jgi:hypothetical protein
MIMLNLALGLIARQWSGDALAAVVAIVLFTAPGAAMAVAVARRLRWGMTAVVAGSFAFSSALAAVVMLVGTWLGLGLEGGLIAWLALGAASSAGAYFVGRGAARVTPDAGGLGFAVVAGIAALMEGPWFRPSADTFYHLAAARSLLESHSLTVTDPFHGTATTIADPTSGVLHTMLALVARLSGLDPAVVWTGLNVLGAIVLVSAFYALVKRLVGPGRPALIGTFAYMVLNQFVDFRAGAYPNRISIALVFFAMMCLVDLLDRPSCWAAVTAVVAGVAVSAMHVGSAELYLLMAFSLGFWALVEGIVLSRTAEGADWRGLRAVAGTLLATGALALPFILPKFSVVSSSAMVDTAAALSRIDLVQLGPFVVTRPDVFFDGGNVLFIMTTALAVLMGGWALVRRDRAALAAFAFCSLPLLLLFDPPVTTLAVRLSFYNLARIAALLGFTTSIAIAWALSRPKDEGGHKEAVFLGVVTLVAAILLSVPYLMTTWTEWTWAYRKGMNVSVWKARATDVRNQWGAGVAPAVIEALGTDRPMVAAEKETGYYLAGLASIRLVAVPASHSPLAIERVSGTERRLAIARLMQPSASERVRREIIDQWGVEYVFLWTSRIHDREAAASMLQQPGLFEEVYSSSRVRLFKVAR